MAQDKWPFPPQVLFNDQFGSASTTSTTGADLWGGSTTKPMGLGPGLILFPCHFMATHANNNKRIDLRLQVSQDGSSWVDADAGGSFPWWNIVLNNSVYSAVDFVLHFNKTQHAQQYAKIQWKTDSGTVSLQAFAADGWANFVKMIKLPTWTAL